MIVLGPHHWFMPSQARPADMKAIIGARFRTLRAALGWQQQTMAGFLNLTPQALSAWEKGKDLPDPLAVARMSLRFGFATDWVWTGSLAGTPWELAAELERRRPDLVLGAPPSALPSPDWDKPRSEGRRRA